MAYASIIARKLDAFDSLLSAQHAADRGPVEEEPQC